MADREATIELTIELGDDAAAEPWVVGLAPCGHDTWHALVARHQPPVDATPEQLRDASDAFDTDLVAASVVWEQDGDDLTSRSIPPPGTIAAAWPDDLPGDAWASLTEWSMRVSGPEGFEWAVDRLRRAPLFRLEAAAAHHYRIPYSVFMGWDDDDRAVAIGYLVETRDVCPGCGVPARLMGQYDVADVVTTVCVWCEVLQADAEGETSRARHSHIALRRGV